MKIQGADNLLFDMPVFEFTPDPALISPFIYTSPIFLPRPDIYSNLKCFTMNRRFTQIAAFLLVFSGAIFLFNGCKKNDRPHMKQLDIKLIADGLASPIGVVAVPDHSKRLFVIDQSGKIIIISGNGNKLPTPFLDVTSK